MNQDVECDVCGGTDFYKESGHYYCNECQTQTQELKEHVFENQPENLNLKSTRKIHRKKADKSETKLTSWNYYNVILASLTDELIQLGAGKDLKRIVKMLWIEYLHKLDVIRDDNGKPKLQLLNSKRDAQILYGIKKRKRRKSNSSHSTHKSHDDASMKRERSRKKRALAISQYDDYSQQTVASSSHLTQTLSSLKSESEAQSSVSSTESNKKVTYNVYGSKYLRKKLSMSKGHLTKHKKDFHHSLDCHKFTHRNLKRKFVQHVSNITPTKLYCLLYLGLLINGDKIQLGDLLRYIREGHISFNYFHHFFASDIDSSALPRDPNCTLLTSLTIRKTTAAMAKFLKVSMCIGVPNIVELTQRYCEELNLPDEICNCVCNLMIMSRPSFEFKSKSTLIPNYEAKIMSFVMFVLKLLFGLDNKTEVQFSKYANNLNDLKIFEKQSFDIMLWLKYIRYRELVVEKYHFPTSYLKEPDRIDSDMFIEYFLQHGKIDENKKLSKQMSNYKEVLTILDTTYEKHRSSINFPHSLTPFKEYSKIILNSKCDVPHPHILKNNFSNSSVDFLLKPYKYLKLLNNKETKNRGANDDIQFLKIDNKDYNRTKKSRDEKKLVICEFVNGEEKYLDQFLEQNNNINTQINPEVFKENWQKGKQKIFNDNKKKIKIISRNIKIPFKFTSEKTYKIHFNPDERYWMVLEQFSLFNFSKEECRKLLEIYPFSFRRIFKECVRIIEQSDQELVYEFQNVELYFGYVCKYGKSKSVNKALDVRLQNMVKKCKMNW